MFILLVNRMLQSQLRLPPEHKLTNFVEELGPGQLVGRQVLGSPCLGSIQVGFSVKKGILELEIIRARGLMVKPGARDYPG